MGKAYDTQCSVCRMMRSLAFTGLGFAVGGGIAYLVGASQENIMLSGIFTAAVLVFGLLDKKKKKP